MTGKRHSARQPAFSQISGAIKTWYKKYTARRNRKKLHQARDIENHTDRKPNAWDLD